MTLHQTLINKHIISFFLLIGFFISPVAYAQDLKEGEALFNTKCTSCHAMDRELVGPRLKGITQKRDEAWLIKWIRNSPAMIAEGDEQAVALFEGYNKVLMTPFPDLTDDNIKNILAYIDHQEAITAPTAVVPGTERPLNQSQTSPYMNWMTGVFALLILFALLAIIVLGKVIKSLEKHILSENNTFKVVKREHAPSPINKEDHLHG